MITKSEEHDQAVAKLKSENFENVKRETVCNSADEANEGRGGFPPGQRTRGISCFTAGGWM